MREEKKLALKRRFEGFTDDWKQSKLGELLELENGYAFKSKYFKKQSMKEIVLTPGNVKVGGGFQAGKGHYYDISGSFPERYIMMPEDIFVTMTDLTPSAQTLGFPAVIPNDGYIYLHNQRLGKLINYIGNKNFLFHLLCTEQYRKQIVMTASGTTVKHSSPSKILNCIVAVPSTEEQQKIGEFFKFLDERIENQERKIAKVTALKSAYLTEMFPQEGETVPKRRFKGFEGEWEKFKLEDLAEISTGYAFSSNQFNSTGKYLVVTNKNIEDQDKGIVSLGDRIDILDKDIIKKFKLNGINVLVTMDGVNIGETGKYTDDNAVLAQRVGRLNSDRIEFIYQITKKNNFRLEMNRISVGNAIKHISLRQIANYSFFAPTLKEEQQKIGQFFKNLDDQISTEEKKLEKLKTMKVAYLEEMFV